VILISLRFLSFPTTNFFWLNIFICTSKIQKIFVEIIEEIIIIFQIFILYLCFWINLRLFLFEIRMLKFTFYLFNFLRKCQSVFSQNSNLFLIFTFDNRKTIIEIFSDIIFKILCKWLRFSSSFSESKSSISDLSPLR